eukprot:1581155-Amphidinium_carterae.1
MGGVNTQDRSLRHHKWGTGLCEWGCQQPDTVAHRLLFCVGTREARAAVGMTNQIRQYLESQPVQALNHCIPCYASYACPFNHEAELGGVFGKETLQEDLQNFARHVGKVRDCVHVVAWLIRYPYAIPGWSFQVCILQVLEVDDSVLHEKLIRATGSSTSWGVVVGIFSSIVGNAFQTQVKVSLNPGFKLNVDSFLSQPDLPWPALRAFLRDCTLHRTTLQLSQCDHPVPSHLGDLAVMAAQQFHPPLLARVRHQLTLDAMHCLAKLCAF